MEKFVGEHSRTENKVSSINNLNSLNQKYFGSGVNIDIKDFKGNIIAKFEISGESLERISETLVTNIKTDLEVRKILLQHEVLLIENLPR